MVAPQTFLSSSIFLVVLSLLSLRGTSHIALLCSWLLSTFIASFRFALFYQLLANIVIRFFYQTHIAYRFASLNIAVRDIDLNRLRTFTLSSQVWCSTHTLHASFKDSGTSMGGEGWKQVLYKKKNPPSQVLG